MSWQGHDFNDQEPLYPWSSTGRDWEARPAIHPQVFPISAYPDLSVTAPYPPSATPSYNYDPRLPPTPGAFEPMLSPTPSAVSSGGYLDSSPVKGHIGQRHLAPTSGTIVSSASYYDPRCPSPWTDATTSPIPSSAYLDPTPIKRPVGEEDASSVFDPEMGAALTPASLCDPSPSPRADPVPSSGPEQQTPHTDVATNLPSGSKRPCRSRPGRRKNRFVGSHLAEVPSLNLNPFLTSSCPVKTQTTEPFGATSKAAPTTGCFLAKGC